MDDALGWLCIIFFIAPLVCGLLYAVLGTTAEAVSKVVTPPAPPPAQQPAPAGDDLDDEDDDEGDEGITCPNCETFIPVLPEYSEVVCSKCGKHYLLDEDDIEDW